MSDQRKRVVEEIYQTEKSYVEQMGYCTDYYYKTLNSENNPTQLKKQEVSELFQHYDQIVNVNTNFKQALEQSRNQNKLEDEIGKILLQFIPFFKVYIPFVSHFDQVNIILDKYEKIPEFYSEMEKIMFSIPTNNPQSLRSYLIQPVQRLPRYELLIRDLLKHTEENHPDYLNLQKALESVKETTTTVNEKTREIEQRNNLFRVNELISGFNNFELIQPDRGLILEGELTKVCKKANKPRYFYLFNDIIVYGIGFQKITVSEYFYLKSVQLENDTRFENSFSIINDVKSFSVICKDAKEKEKWFNEINKYAEIQKELSSTNPTVRPLWVPDKDTENCLTCGKIFTAINRRHHCRKCGRCICGDCSKGRMVLKEGGDPERVCIYCLDLTKLTPEQQHQFKKNQMKDKSEVVFDPLTFNAATSNIGKKQRIRKKSTSDISETKSFTEIMNGDSTKQLAEKATTSMVFNFVNDSDINLKSSYDKTHSLDSPQIQFTQSIESVDQPPKAQTLGTMQTDSTIGLTNQQNHSTSTPRNAFLELSMKNRPMTLTENKLKMEYTIDENTTQNQSIQSGKKEGGIDGGRKTPTQHSRPKIGDRRTRKLQSVDLSQFQNEILQPNQSLTSTTSDISSNGNSAVQTPKQRVGIVHPIPLQTGKEEKKLQNVGDSKQKEKETMVDNLDMMVSDYMGTKHKRSVTPKSTSPFDFDEKKQTQTMNQSRNTKQPKSTTNSSFNQPYDFNANSNKIMLPPKSSSSGPNQSSKRCSIPQSFDFSTETNLFNTMDSPMSQTPQSIQSISLRQKSSGSISPQSGYSPRIPSESPNLHGFTAPPKSPRGRQQQKRANTTTNTPLFCSQLPQQSSQQHSQYQQYQTKQQIQQPSSTQNVQQTTMFDFTTNNDFNTLSPSLNPTVQHQQHQQYLSQSKQPTQQQYNQSTDLFSFTKPDQQTQRKEQPKKLGITIESAPSRTNQFQSTHQRKQVSQSPNQSPQLFQSMQPQPSIQNQSQPMQSLQMQSQIQNPMQQKQFPDPPKQKHPRRRMSRSRSRSKDRQSEPSENMKKLGEMYNECQKEQQFNLSSSFFDITTIGSPNKSIGNSLNSSGSIPSENKITVSKQERQTMILSMNELNKPNGTNENEMKDAKESKVMRNRRLYEQRIKKQKEEEKRDFMLRSSVMSGFK